MKRLPLICVLGTVLMLALCGCRNPNRKFMTFNTGPLQPSQPKMETIENRFPPELLQAPTNLFTLGPGDRLDVELIDEPTSKVTTVVGPDGKIYFNLLPGIDVWGLTLGEAKGRMESELAQYIRGSPRVNLTLRAVESKKVWLLGRFQEPGVYNMPGPMTLLEAVSMAGGSLTYAGTRQLTGGPLSEDLADFKRSFIVRNGQLLPVDFEALLTRGDLAQNIYLHPDDLVYFSPAYTREVYVLGAVVQPQPVAFHDGLTLAGAIAGAYGTVRDAYIYNVVIVRGSLTKPQTAIVNYKGILEGREPDIALEAHDIVYVPLAPYRYIRRYAEIALNTFVSSVAINAGARVIGQPAGAAGIFIPVGSGVQIIPPQAPPIGQ